MVKECGSIGYYVHNARIIFSNNLVSIEIADSIQKHMLVLRHFYLST